ncbi:MAG: MBL fold metallo-hydrolase [Anaerolineae bacterium]|nr:MBL fold metallo-hydrolase [Anaerolineae bacterium]
MGYKRFFPQTMILVLITLLLTACCAPAETPTPEPTQEPAPTTEPTPAPKPAAVTIYYEENAQVELISSAGQRVLIDVYSPSALTSPAVEEDVLLTTHAHQDHVNSSFLDTFPGQQLYIREGEIALEDVTIRGIAAAHNAYDTPQPEGGTDYIFVVDMDGLRIAHFGDIGQDELTQEQLDALGEVDVAITQFDNSFSQMNLVNEKGFNLMSQVKPKLIIPTHGGSKMEVVEQALELWKGSAVDEGAAMIGRSDLSDETQFLVMGQMAPALQKIYDLPEWK